MVVAVGAVVAVPAWFAGGTAAVAVGEAHAQDLRTVDYSPFAVVVLVNLVVRSS